MKLNVTTALTNLAGVPIGSDQVSREALVVALNTLHQDRDAGMKALVDLASMPEPLTLRMALCNALMGQYKGEETLSGTEKVKRWRLAQDVHSKDEPYLTSEQTTMAKELIAKAYTPVVVGPAWELLDPASAEKAGEEK